MKKYIYIDTNLISTYLAQINQNGLSDSSTFAEESIKINQKCDSNIEPSTSQGIETSFPLLKLAYSINNEVKNISKTISVSDSAKKEVTYKQHAINKLNQFLQIEYNDSINIQDYFLFYDLDEIIDISNFVFTENHKLIFEPIIKEQYKGTKNIKSALQKHKDEMAAGLNSLKLFKLSFPSSIYLESSKYIVPLNKNYLFYETSLIPILFNNKTKVIGIEGPSLNSDLDKNTSGNLLYDMKESLNSIKKTFFQNLNMDINKKILIPIAWYQD